MQIQKKYSNVLHCSNVFHNAAMLFIIEEAKETVLDFKKEQLNIMIILGFNVILI